MSLRGLAGVRGRVAGARQGRGCTAGPGVLLSAPCPPTWCRDLGGIRAQSLPCLGWGLVGHCAQPSGVSSHPVGTRSPHQKPGWAAVQPQGKLSSRATQGRTEWGSQASRDPLDPQGLLSTCRSRT